MKRRRGRPPKRWTNIIKEETPLPASTIKNYEKDCINWKRIVNTKWAQPLLGSAK